MGPNFRLNIAGFRVDASQISAPPHSPFTVSHIAHLHRISAPPFLHRRLHCHLCLHRVTASARRLSAPVVQLRSAPPSLSISVYTASARRRATLVARLRSAPPSLFAPRQQGDQGQKQRRCSSGGPLILSPPEGVEGHLCACWGLVRAVGVSNYGPKQLIKIHDYLESRGPFLFTEYE